MVATVDVFGQAVASYEKSEEQPEEYDAFLRLVDTFWTLPGALAVAKLHASQADGWRQLAAIDILGRVPVSEAEESRQLALEALLRLLYNHQDDSLTVPVISALGALGEGAALPALASVAASDDADTREAVAGALATTIRDPLDLTTRQILLDFLHDDSPEVRDWAAFCFGNSTEWDSHEVRAALRVLCLDPDPDVHEEAVRALAQRGDAAAVAFVKLMIEEPGVSELVIEAAGETADHSLFPALLSLHLSGVVSEFLPVALTRTDPSTRPGMLAKERDLVAALRTDLAEARAPELTSYDVLLAGSFPHTRVKVMYSRLGTPARLIDLGRIWGVDALDRVPASVVAELKLHEFMQDVLPD